MTPLIKGQIDGLKDELVDELMDEPKDESALANSAKLVTPEYQRALAAATGFTVDDIVLRGAQHPALRGLDLRLIAEQVAQRQRARAKLPSWASNPAILWAPALSLEQASSERLAHYKRRCVSPPGTAPAASPGSRLLDLSGGMGVDAWSLAAGFSHTLVVERDPHLAALLQHNLATLHPAAVADGTLQVVQGDALEFDFRSVPGAGPLTVFVDPARRDAGGGRVMQLNDCSPDISQLLPKLPPEAIRLVLKAAPMLDITLAIRQLEAASPWRVVAVHVVALTGDCREVLYVLEPPPAGWVAGDRRLFATHLLDGRSQLWSHSAGAVLPTAKTTAPIGPVGRYLFDPNPALRKLNQLGPLCHALDLTQLARNTLLLTGDRFQADFPGRVFEVEAGPVSKVRRALPEGRASIVSRNHPRSAAELRRQWRLKEDADQYLFAFRDHRDRPVLWTARRCV